MMSASDYCRLAEWWMDEAIAELEYAIARLEYVLELSAEARTAPPS